MTRPSPKLGCRTESPTENLGGGPLSAREAGVLLAIDSDAHSGAELAYSDAIAHARLAGIPPERVINCWPVERLLDWARARVTQR